MTKAEQRHNTAVRLRQILIPGMGINAFGVDGIRPRWVTDAINEATRWVEEFTPEWKALQYVAENERAYIVLGGKSDAVERGIRMALAEIQRLDSIFHKSVENA